jgi:hypothetical protein
VASDLAAGKFGELANATQIVIESALISLQVHLVELLMQLKIQLNLLLIWLQVILVELLMQFKIQLNML